MNQFVLPQQFVTDDNGNPLTGAKLRFYRAGTLETLTVYQDALFATAHDPENITSNANGRLPAVFIKDERYKVAVYDADDVLIFGPYDNLNGQLDVDNLISSQELYNTPVKEIQADYTATVNDLQKNTFLNTKPIANDVTIELPSAAEVGNGYGLTVRSAYSSEYKITVIPKPATSETIDEAGFIDITTFNEQVRFTSDGANWIAAKYIVPAQSITLEQLDPRLQGAFLSAGMIVEWPGKPEKAPAGLLPGDGQLVSIDQYPDLYDKYGVMYGGDGVTTFGIPDLRGYSLRGLDDGAGRDPDAASRTARPDGVGGDNIGTTQLDDFKLHSHTGTVDPGGEHTHGINVPGSAVAVNNGPHGVFNYFIPSQTAADGEHTHTFTTAETGGSETRAKNFAVKLYIVASPELNAGASGALTKVHSVVGAPPNTLGINGDFAIDPNSSRLYGPKTGGAWPSEVSLRGEDGQDGLDGVSNIFVQSAEPTGNDGDLWLRSSDSQVFKQSTGAWSDTGLNIKGDAGETGDIGVNWLDAWSSATDYVLGDGVSHNGSSYYCKVPNTNNAPPNATYWGVIANKGADGSGTGDLVAANNLSDINNAATARGNLGLGSVDNTSDAEKPISNATQTALDGKANNTHNHALSDISGAGALAALNSVGSSNIDNNSITANELNNTGVTAGHYTSADFTVDEQGRITAASNGSGAGSSEILHIRDVRASGVQGGAVAVGHNVRPITEVVKNTIPGASVNLAGNSFTLPAGEYEPVGWDTGYGTQYTKARIYNTTDALAVSIGSAAYATSATINSILSEPFTITDSKDFVVHRYTASTSPGADSMGAPTSNGDQEVYMDLKLRKIA